MAGQVSTQDRRPATETGPRDGHAARGRAARGPSVDRVVERSVEGPVEGPVERSVEGGRAEAVEEALLRRRAREAGMATAEYAIATLAAVGFAGLLIGVLRSDEVRGLLAGIVRQALSL